MEFEQLSYRLCQLPNSYKLRYFMTDLKDEVRLIVKMFNPPYLLTAFRLTKIQEEHIKVNKKGV